MHEYFYNDYEKLGLVLGEKFFESTVRVDTKSFALFKPASNLAQQYRQNWRYELKKANTLTVEDFTSIYAEVNTAEAELDDE